jgi:hypothetical protein
MPESKTTKDLGMWLPSLPHPWALHQLQEQWREGGKNWHAVIYQPMHGGSSFHADGDSPRGAILKCLDKMEMGRVGQS